VAREAEWVELCLDIVHDTDRAICVDDGDGRMVWLPRSTIRPSDVGTGPADIEVQYWIAHREGLI